MKLTAEQKDSRTRIVAVNKNLIQITVSEEAARETFDFLKDETEECPDSYPDVLDGVQTIMEALEKGLKQLHNNRKKGSRANR